jgi:hypothetical protein
MSEIERGEELWSQIRRYVNGRAIWTEAVRLGVPLVVDRGRIEGEPWTNPDRAEVRVHSADFAAIRAYARSLEPASSTQQDNP